MPAFGISLQPASSQVGTAIGLATRVAHAAVQDVIILSLWRNEFILCHSFRNPLSVASGIFAPVRVVSKYFTPSTPAP